MTIPGYIDLLRSRGHRHIAIARAAGVTASTISGWKVARWTPTLEQAARVADEFNVPGFVDTVREARTRACQRCGTPFIAGAHTTGLARYCSQPCARRTHNDTYRAELHRLDVRRLGYDLKRVKKELALYKAAAVANCRSCEPLGVCHDAACEMRPVSPLPLAAERVRVA